MAISTSASCCRSVRGRFCRRISWFRGTDEGAHELFIYLRRDPVKVHSCGRGTPSFFDTEIRGRPFSIRSKPAAGGFECYSVSSSTPAMQPIYTRKALLSANLNDVLWFECLVSGAALGVEELQQFLQRVNVRCVP